MMQKSGDRRPTDSHFLRRQNGLDLSQRDIRLLRQQLPHQLLVRRQSISLVTAKFGGTDTARFAVKPTKAHDRADTHAKLLRSFRNRGAIPRRPDYAFPQILRIRLPHSMLAALPVRILNPIRAQKGIPPDSVFPGTALIWPWQDRQRRFSWLKATTFALMLVPAIRTEYLIGVGDYGNTWSLALPALTYWSGVWATVILLMALAVTPAATIFR